LNGGDWRIVAEFRKIESAKLAEALKAAVGLRKIAADVCILAAVAEHETKMISGCLSNKTALATVYKLVEAAEKNWRRLDGHNQSPKIILGVKFTNEIEVVRSQAQTDAA
jgi:hypothetical protein